MGVVPTCGKPHCRIKQGFPAVVPILLGRDKILPQDQDTGSRGNEETSYC